MILSDTFRYGISIAHCLGGYFFPGHGVSCKRDFTVSNVSVGLLELGYSKEAISCM